MMLDVVLWAGGLFTLLGVIGRILEVVRQRRALDQNRWIDTRVVIDAVSAEELERQWSMPAYQGRDLQP